MSGIGPVIIEAQGLEKVYGSGENRVEALRGVNLAWLKESLSQSWGHPARARARSCT